MVPTRVEGGDAGGGGSSRIFASRGISFRRWRQREKKGTVVVVCETCRRGWGKRVAGRWPLVSHAAAEMVATTVLEVAVAVGVMRQRENTQTRDLIEGEEAEQHRFICNFIFILCCKKTSF